MDFSILFRSVRAKTALKNRFISATIGSQMKWLTRTNAKIGPNLNRIESNVRCIATSGDLDIGVRYS